MTYYTAANTMNVLWSNVVFRKMVGKEQFNMKRILLSVNR